MTIQEGLAAIAQGQVDITNATTSLTNYLAANPSNPDVAGLVQPILDSQTASVTALKALVPPQV